MALNSQVKEQVKAHFSTLKSKFTFKLISKPNLKESEEMRAFLEDVASCSDLITIEEEAGNELSFSILHNNEDKGLCFRAIPNGHEFTTLLLAVLNLDGIGKNLPDSITHQRIENIKTTIELKSYISLTCPNCPDVVQALNVIAMLNPNISHQIIDGNMNMSEVDELNIQAIPAVYANGKPFHVGRSSLGELIQKLEEFSGTTFTAENKEEKEYDVIVAGGGPSGCAAAIYSARKGFKTAIIAEKIGGQVIETVDIENLISVPKTTGSQLAGNLKLHLSDYNIDILENRLVASTKVEDGMKIIKSSLGESFKTPALIIATGASWRKLGIPGENEYIGSGVAFCTHCDGPFYKGKKVAVIGGGNSGLEAAIDLASIANEVTVIEFLDTLKGDQVLQDKLKSLNNVNIITNTATTEIIGNGSKVTALKYKNRETDNEESLELDGVFVQIGLKANSDVFKDIVETNRMGEIIIDAHCRTKVAGVYAAGDVSEVPYKQIIIAMGEGAKAALSAFDDNIKGALLK